VNLQWFTSPEWANVVKALLHTLWQGAIVAVLLGLALRRLENPVARYRCSLTALGCVVLAGLVTWAVLNRPVSSPVATAPAPAASPMVETTLPTDEAPLVVHSPPAKTEAAGPGWTAWLALAWLAGATLMIGRAGWQVTGAERLRRTSQPLTDPRIAELLAEARRAVGLARRVRLAVTDRLTSPAVVGVLVPTLILPLTLATTLTPEQIRFILLHELAHIRRGDYFANLFQLFAEALLFFNPAVWWMSHQMRIEREACCDALAIELSGAPADYARTLVHVAESVLIRAPQAAPAFGDKREPSSLADRVQRLLVPGYRPRLRLTWRAMLGSLFVGAALLVLSAIGTRVTVAAILSPQQRIDRIEKKMAELGQNPDEPDYYASDAEAPKVEISGTLRTADGTPVPKWIYYMRVYSSLSRSSVGSSLTAKSGKFSSSISAGTIYVGADVADFAPAVLGPLDGFATNRYDNLELVLDRGFDVPLQLVDEVSGQPVADASLTTMFWMSNDAFPGHTWKSGADGTVTLTHCADLPLDVTVNAPGYAIIKKRFEHLRAGEPVRLTLRRGETLAGTVIDKTTGQPLAGAKLHLLYQVNGKDADNHGWDDLLYVLGETDANGAFNLNQLQSGVRYYLGVSAPGHESVILKNAVAGANRTVVQLGPELIVHGHVNGNIELLPLNGRHRMLSLSWNEVYEHNSYGSSEWVLVHVTNGVATFQFTNRTAGNVTLTGADYREDREVTAPIDDWAVNLTEAPKPANQEVPKREVVFRFNHPSGVPPQGTVQVEIPDNLDINHLTSHYQTMGFTNGEVHAQIAIGGRTSIEPKRMVGYWFNRAGINGNLLSIVVTNGVGPMLIDIPLIPAGAIYAKVRNADGTPAGGLFFGVTELKRAPGRDQNSLDGSMSDTISDNAPRQWVSGPLPLGGKYQIYAYRGNSFCVSQPVKLTDSDPDAEVELQFAPGKKFMGEVLDADGKPLPDAELKTMFTLATEHNFGLTSLYANERGWFELADATPEQGQYSVEVDAPGVMAESVKLDFSAQPQVIRLKRGHTLAGRVVEAGTGYPIPGEGVRALDFDRNQLPMVTTLTDADGRFEFNTLGDVTYTLYTADGEIKSDKQFRADGNTNVVLVVKLYGWSTVKPKMAASATAGEAVSATSRRDNPVDLAGRNLTLLSRSPAGAGTNVPEVLVTAHFYEARNPDFADVKPALKFNLDEYGSLWVALSANQFGPVRNQLRQAAFQEKSAPRVVTISGEEARMFIGDSTNNTRLDCTPVVTNGQVSLMLNFSVVATQAGALVTNQFHTVATMENHGGILMRSGYAAGTGQSNVVALVGVEIITNAAPRFQQRLVQIIKRAGDTNTDAADLVARTYKVDSRTFIASLKRAGAELGDKTNSPAAISSAVRTFLTSLGVNLESPAGKSVFYNDRNGMLFARATPADQDIIEHAIVALSQVAPQIHIKARFLQVSNGTVAGLGNLLNSTNAAGTQFTGILRDADRLMVLHRLDLLKGSETLGEPEVTTMSGRQCQIRATQTITVISNYLFQENTTTNVNGVSAITPQTIQFEAGPMLDVVPYVLADGYTINLTVIPTLNEFLGYDTGPDVPNVTGTNNRVQLPVFFPRFSTRQMTATLNLRDNQTVVIGGMPEIKSYTHKTPVLGSVPLMGRLFRSENSTTNELLVLVTATIVDPAGNRVHSEEELSRLPISAAPDVGGRQF
jgi:beta-lactamase regulating signal transducer with metallopeptidase domain/type II secretory pathway component GspD/PulD (secretin)